MSNYSYDYATNRSGHHHQYLLPPLLRLLPKGRRLRVLDLGCGNGSLTAQIAKQGHDVTGIDSSKTGVEHARASWPGVRFENHGFEELTPELFGGPFDVVVSLEVIEHVYRPRDLLRTARSLLKPDGLLIVSTPYHGYLKNLAIAATGRFDHHVAVHWDGGHIKFFSVKSLTSLLADEGFVDPHFEFGGRTRWLWKTMVCASRPAPK